MEHKYEIILSGVGGQGLITSGSILGQAAVVYENMNASLTSSYGVETRGTFTKADVIISKGEIYYPEVLKADVILTLASIAYNKYIPTLNKDTILIYDSNLISEVKNSDGKQYGYPITELAIELGSEKITNIIAIGIIARKIGVLKKESVIQVIKNKFSGKEKIQKLNIQAFEKGFEMASESIL